MAVQERQPRTGDYKGFSSRLPEETYIDLEKWAWERRLSLAHACSILLRKAIAAERGKAAYAPEPNLKTST